MYLHVWTSISMHKQGNAPLLHFGSLCYNSEMKNCKAKFFLKLQRTEINLHFDVSSNDKVINKDQLENILCLLMRLCTQYEDIHIQK